MIKHSAADKFGQSRKSRPLLLLVVNVDWFFLSHRLPIAREAILRGYDVHLATEVTRDLCELERLGVFIHPISFGRGSASVTGVVTILFKLAQLFRVLRPDIVHLVTIKPVLLGGLMARLLRIPAKVSAISGMGYIFTSRGIRAAARQRLIRLLYRLALGHQNARVIFQNSADRELVMRMAGIAAADVRMIPGSGVNLEQFQVHPFPEGAPVVMMASRLLVDKGVFEFVDAARRLRHTTARFVLVGDADPGNPATLSRREIEKLQADGDVEVVGYRSDMAALLSQSWIVVLPSYREGFPKVLLEGAACGRAVVTTDVPGCRDAILPGETGLLVAVGDSDALASAILRLLENQSELRRMGSAGRRWVECNHSAERVVAAHMEIYSELLLNRSH